MRDESANVTRDTAHVPVFPERPENHACTARSLDLQHLDFCAVRNDGPRTESRGRGVHMCCGGLI